MSDSNNTFEFEVEDNGETIVCWNMAVQPKVTVYIQCQPYVSADGHDIDEAHLRLSGLLITTLNIKGDKEVEVLHTTASGDDYFFIKATNLFTALFPDQDIYDVIEQAEGGCNWEEHLANEYAAAADLRLDMMRGK